MEKITITAQLDAQKKCILIDADGSAEIKFITDATQLAKVLQCLAEFKDSTFTLILKPLAKGLQNAGRKKSAQTIR